MCLGALNILTIVSRTDWSVDSTYILNWYRSLIRSQWDYVCFIYGSTCISYIKLLDTVYHQGLWHTIEACRFNSSNPAVLIFYIVLIGWFGFMVFNTTINNISVISWLLVLMAGEIRVPGEYFITCCTPRPERDSNSKQQWW